MWLIRHKYLADDTLSRYKARLIANGSTQLESIDDGETFSLVVKPGTIRTVHSLATSQHWLVHQLDVKNAFFHGLSIGSSRPLGLGFSDVLLILLVLEMLLSRRKYDAEILERAHMANCNPSQTPVDTESKLGDDVQQVCLYMHDPWESYFSALKRILRYVRGTLDHGLQLFLSSTTYLVAYSDMDWAGCPTTRRYTSGTDSANITRKRTNPDKHGHGNGKSTKEPEDCY
ncbi:ribonuclease H-like domain-containing protein [Tanacetum coccineum]